MSKKRAIIVAIAVILCIIYARDLSEKRDACESRGGELVKNYAGQHVCVGGGK